MSWGALQGIGHLLLAIWVEGEVFLMLREKVVYRLVECFGFLLQLFDHIVGKITNARGIAHDYF
jgi:hypothetical protein